MFSLYLRSKLIFLLGFMLLFVASCASSEAVQYHFGIVTTSIEGRLKLDPFVLQKQKVFILVDKEQAQLIKTVNGRLTYRQVALVHVARRGKFFVPFDNETRTVKLHIFARGYKVINENFDRTMGVSSYTFSPKLEAIPHWEDTYYLTIRPLILEYIAEPKNGLTTTERSYLNSWLLEMNKQYKK